MPYLCSSRPTWRAAREHADVARERELQARAERVAVHRGDRRVARVGEPRERLLRAQDAVDGRVGVARARRRRRLRSQSVEPAGEHRRVDARRERAAVADHDDRAQLGVVAQLLAERAHLAATSRS